MSESNNPNTPLPDDANRRDFLKFAAVGVLGAAYAGMVGYPVYQYLASPVDKAASEGAVKEVVVDKAGDLPKNAALMFKFGQKPAILIHHDDDSWTAVSAVCTHLGCTAGYDPAKKIIFCPCHGGTYDPHSGANLGGPPPKPLDRFTVKINDGKAVVSRA
jgi:cytochrome b6-f complex iron-sulfur subunit